MKEFSIKEALSFGWQAFKSRIGFFIGLFLLYEALMVIPQLGVQRVADHGLAVPLAVIILIFRMVSASRHHQNKPCRR
jgi:hypothetical protein